MGTPSIILLVFLGIIAVLLILIVLIQNEQGDGLGGLFGGGGGSAFGPRSGNILTKITTGLAILFFGFAFLFAWIQSSGTKETDIQIEHSKNIGVSSFNEKIEQINSRDIDEKETVEIIDESEIN